MQKHGLVFGGISLPGVPINFALTLLRVVAGSAMAFAHGLGKLPPSTGFVSVLDDIGFPFPILFAWLAALAEFAGGLCVALGLATRPAAFLVTLTMAVAVFLRHSGDSFAEREAAVLFGAIFLLFTVMGAGRVSIDALIRKD